MAVNLVNTRHERLFVEEDLGIFIKEGTKHKAHWYRCKCDCGNSILARHTRLLKDKIKSCGCYKKEVLDNFHKNCKKYNDYYIKDNVAHIKLFNSNEECLVDADVIDKIKDYCWYKNSKNYIVANIDGKSVKLHRYIINVKTKDYVDHINHNQFDNRRCNLRVVTPSENSMNRITPSNNKSGVKGVYFDKESNKWRATITSNNKRINLGRFESLEEATRVRKEAEIKYHGDFRYKGGIWENY